MSHKIVFIKQFSLLAAKLEIGQAIRMDSYPVYTQEVGSNSIQFNVCSSIQIHAKNDMILNEKMLCF
jgi:hypothetical protein